LQIVFYNAPPLSREGIAKLDINTYMRSFAIYGVPPTNFNLTACKAQVAIFPVVTGPLHIYMLSFYNACYGACKTAHVPPIIYFYIPFLTMPMPYVGLHPQVSPPLLMSPFPLSVALIPLLQSPNLINHTPLSQSYIPSYAKYITTQPDSH
jgi:hypothetical protein